MPGRKYKFPSTRSCKRDNPGVLCTADRVLKLYNEKSGKKAQRISKSVRSWFAAKAYAAGWTGVHFLPEIQSAHGAGCILWLPPQQVNVVINVTNQTLVLHSQDE